jgi:hypothetical protein
VVLARAWEEKGLPFIGVGEAVGGVELLLEAREGKLTEDGPAGEAPAAMAAGVRPGRPRAGERVPRGILTRAACGHDDDLLGRVTDWRGGPDAEWAVVYAVRRVATWAQPERDVSDLKFDLPLFARLKFKIFRIEHQIRQKGKL